MRPRRATLPLLPHKKAVTSPKTQHCSIDLKTLRRVEKIQTPEAACRSLSFTGNAAGRRPTDAEHGPVFAGPGGWGGPGSDCECTGGFLLEDKNVLEMVVQHGVPRSLVVGFTLSSCYHNHRLEQDELSWAGWN